uniref:ATP synthase F0 subunit 8 n=1 Tax=Symplana brevistrata TaxID=2231408 RepID=UPI001E6AD3B9|nr:ATP synthase F0 subunit 8 [Symplana brevistrata]UDL72009.1 ATP synthase F0 subunit 8 [Symplana brevistrata]
MPQMSPIWWTPMLILSLLLTTQILTNLEYNKFKKKKKNKKIKKKNYKILW